MKYSVPKLLLRLSWKIVMAGLILPFSAPTKAEVTLDGTLGPAGSLAGPNFMIPDTVGQTVGTNLFHSFGLFNINTSESATFTGPPAIDNVISRVTGGSQSFIDGLLRSEIQSANLWFINPAGVLFDQHASLDIQGSFHVSTADYLKLGDGGRFEATNPEDSVLTVAPPEAFGFLGERQPAGIAVQGSRLQVPAGETLSVVGGDIRIADGSLYAPGGRIDMVSVASPGEVLPHAPDLGVASFEQLGRIEVLHSSSERPLTAAGNVIGNVDASGEGGGRIFIRGGELVADNASILANTWGSEEGQGINIGATDQVTVRNGARITADTFGSGSSGDVTVEAGSLEVRNGAEISASSFGFGQGGNVTINATDITLQDGGRISAEAEGFGGTQADAGNITLEVGNLLHLSNDSSITTSARGEGSGSNITLNSVFIVLNEGSSIIANALEGQGGKVFIRILGGGALFKAPDSRIEASSEFGIEGSVEFVPPVGLAALPANFLDAATVLTQLCAGRSGANVSSLVVRKYEVLPDSPYALRVQLPRTMPTPRTAKQSGAPRTYYAGNPLPPMISCLGNG
jgi:filamentous hemagglutinin family protein